MKLITHNHSEKGFTLTEVVVVLVVMSILAIGSSRFIALSAQGLVDSAERQILASAATIAVEKVLRAVRGALPNSVRVFNDNGNVCIEYVPILFSSEYVTLPLSRASTSFEAIKFVNASAGESGYVAVYPTSEQSVYGALPSITRAVSTQMAHASGVDIPSLNLQTLTFSSASSYRFPTGSPHQRFFLVSSPVAYCNDSEGYLWRYENYGFHVDSRAYIPTTGNDRQLVSDSIQANGLNFNVTPMQLQRNAVVTMDVSVIRAGSHETLDVRQEVQLRNVP